MDEQSCEHIAARPVAQPQPPLHGCADCIAANRSDWVHLRVCQSCGHIGCCDSSPGKHATAHYVASGHPVVRSYEPGEHWWWCYLDHVLTDIAGAQPAPHRSGLNKE